MIDSKLQKRYKIIQELGSGGFGTTYLAQDINCFNNKVAIKKLTHGEESGLDQQDLKLRFEQEGEVVNQLSQKTDKIPQLLDSFEENGKLHLVHKFIEGDDLSKELLQKNKWSDIEVINFLIEILQILHLLHENNIVHRDIKPSNLIRRKEDGKIVLIDFGSIKKIVPNKPLQITVRIGTQFYIAPEQAKGQPRFSSDIYSLGIMMIQAITNYKLDTVSKIIKDETDRLPFFNHLKSFLDGQDPCNEELIKILKTMVAFHFTDRYQSASEVLDDLEKLKQKCEEENITSNRPIDPKSNNFLIPVSLIALTLALITVGLGIRKQPLVISPTPSATPDQTSTSVFPLPQKDDIPNNTAIRIGGSTTMNAINENYKQKFEEQFGDRAEIRLPWLDGSDNGMIALCKGKIEIAASSKPWEKTIQECSDHTQLRSITVDKDILAVYVHHTSPLTNLTLNQVRRIFQCQVSDWSKISQDWEEQIIVTYRPDKSGTNSAFNQLFSIDPSECESNYQESKFNGIVYKYEPKNNSLDLPIFQKLIEDQYTKYIRNMQPNEISYGAYTQLGLQKTTVKLISIDGVQPAAEDYPYSRPLLYVYRVNPNGTLVNPEVRFFLGFVEHLNSSN